MEIIRRFFLFVNYHGISENFQTVQSHINRDNNFHSVLSLYDFLVEVLTL